MAVEVEKLIIALEARMDQYNRSVAATQRQTQEFVKNIERSFTQFERQIKSSTSSAALSMTGFLGTIGAYLSVQELTEYANAWTRVTRSIAAGEEVFGMRLRSADALLTNANDARIDVEAYAKTYIRTAAAVRDLGYDEAIAADVTTTLAKALKLGSAAATEQASTILQFSQALQKGKLDGDEFRTVMENAGVIQELLADRVKVSKGEIVKMAAEGKLKLETLVGAMIDGKDKIDRIFKGMPQTIDEAWTVLNNSVTQYIGHLDKAHGGSATLASAITAVASNIENVGDSAMVLGAALLAAFGPRVLLGVASVGTGIATMAGPVGLLAGVVGGLATAYGVLADNIQPVTGELFTLKDLIDATVAVVGDAMTPALDMAAAAWAVAVAKIQSALAGIPVSFFDVLAAAQIAANATIGVFVAASKGIYAAMVGVPPAIAQIMIDMANKVIAAVEHMVNSIMQTLSAIPGIELPDVDFSRIENSFAGASDRLRSDMSEAGQALGVDYIGAFGRGIDSAKEAVFAQAREIAALREAAGVAPERSFTPKRALQSPPDAKKAKLNPFEREVKQIQDRTAALLLEQRMLGATALETEKARAAQELLNAARDAGIKQTPELLAKVNELAEAYARAKVQTEALSEAFGFMKSAASDVLSTVIKDIRAGKDAMDSLASAIDSVTDRLIDMAVNKLVEQAFGAMLGSFGPVAGSGGPVSFSMFARGGIATPQGPKQLRKMSLGGVRNEASIFAEAGPEAAVPLPDGRSIPVTLKMPRIPRADAPIEVRTPAPVTKVNIINQVPDTQVERRPSSAGGASAEDFIITAVQKGVAQGRLDPAFGGRFGARPMKGVR